MRYLKNVPSTTSTSSALYYERKPDSIGRCTAFGRYLYNKDDRTACNRTATSWCLLLGFYIAFLACCWGLLVLMIFVGVTIIDHFSKGQLFDVASMKHPLY